MHYLIDNQGIVTLTMDMPGRSANVLNHEFGKELEEALLRLAAEKANIKGIILTSAKKTFLAGGDIDYIFAITDAKQAFDEAEALKAGFRKIEKLGKPVVAAINGSALGGGLELALACHYRIALADSSLKIGLPEVKLGLIPGGGGITRIVRMIGLQAAFPILTKGAEFSPKDAQAQGIINDTAASVEEMLEKAVAYILANPNAKQPWDKEGYKLPGGSPTHPAVAQMLPIAPAFMMKETWGNYPAVEYIMNTAVEGAQVDFDTALRIESRYFASAVVSKEAKNMMTAFWYQLNEINAGKSRPEGFKPCKVEKVGIIGAGMMGAGIAYVAALSNISVVLKDVSLENAQKGKAYSEKILKKRLENGKTTAEKMAAILERILPTDNAQDFLECDLVIEAVFENRELKAKVTQQAEHFISEKAFFASNTSTLPISGLATASRSPEKFVGLHFFSPVDKMPLVEIIKGQETSDETLARAFDFVKQLRKTPIIVNDSRGFYTSRVFSTYVLEGAALLAEGCHPQEIENAGRKAGMPVGPLALLDEVSLSLVYDIREQTKKDMLAEGEKVISHPADSVIDIMVLQHQRKGKAAGAGFYEYPKGEKKHLWQELTTLFPPQKGAVPFEDMIDRMMFAQVIESLKCLKENVVTTVQDANIGSVFGWGFAPFKGGTLQYIEDMGIEHFQEKMKRLSIKYGNRFYTDNVLHNLVAEK